LPGSATNVWTVNRLAAAVAAGAGLTVLLTLGDPGLTTDEPLDVRPGRTYVATLRAQGRRFFDPQVIDRVFRDNAEHPPLGRWLLGIASTLGEPFETWWLGPDPVGLYVLSARVAPALAFAALVGVVVRTAGRRYGRAAGVAAGLSLPLMPRVFAHAHFGALDTFLALFWTVGLLTADRALASRRPVAAMALAGGALALALLTKIHAWFLLPIVGAWALLRLPVARASAGVAAWVATGFALFVLGWPWLWHDPVARLARFWGTGVERAVIHVQYFGRVYADRDVPWHYPWFYFAVTVPVGLQLLGAVGVFRAWRARADDRFPFLLVGSIVFFLILFSTGVPVYDGERLFLLVFPLWAVVIGRGFASAWHGWAGRPRLRAALAAFLVAQAYGTLALHPFGLSYYNLLVCGLPGAERLGLELTYWGDAVDRVLLDDLVRLAPLKASAALVPTLYPGQGLATTTRAMARHPVLLLDERAAAQADWLVVSRRTAYWKPDLKERLSDGRRVSTRSRQGVWLSALIHGRGGG
jgi:4-amino-4-deoxy-L-arabinose transferase-like glycosyltransferase